MERNLFRILIWALIAGVSACLAILALQQARISQLLRAQQGLSAEMAALSDKVGIQGLELAESRSEVSALGSQIAELSRYVSELTAADPAPETSADFSPKIAPGLLARGIYILPATNEEGEESSYTVYHVATDVRVRDFKQGLQFGAARAGLISWQFYFDYNNDGRVDTDMLSEFVESIPFGSYVTGSLNRERSQRIYDRFLSSTADAEYLSVDDIEAGGSEIARQMWSYVSDSSEQLVNWIWEQAGGDEPADPGEEPPN